MYVISIQDSFEAVIADVVAGTLPSDLFWVARRHVTSEVQELHHVTVSQTHTTVFSGPVGFEQLADNTYSVLFAGDRYTLISPAAIVNVAARDVSAAALSALGDFLVVGTDHGAVAVYDTATQTKTGEIAAAHFLDVSGVWVMPSDKVILTVGTDHHAKLWSVPHGPEAAAPARVFAKVGMADAALIGRGRNFVTAGNSADVWECGSGSVVHTWRGKCRCVATEAAEEAAAPAQCAGDRPGQSAPVLDYCNTNIYIGYESGTVQQHTSAGAGARLDLRSPISALSACGLVAIGTEDGSLVMWDPKTLLHRTLALDPNYAVEHIVARKSGDAVEVVVCNGPDMLVRVVYDGEFRTQHLVGFAELSHVRLLHCNSHTLVAASCDQLAFYSLV